MKRIYVASRASIPARVEMWKKLRDSGINIISTWIDDSHVTLDNLWSTITLEIAKCDGLILYAELDDFPLKGALIECGMALGLGKPVAIVMPNVEIDQQTYRPIGSWVSHPLIRICHTIDTACAYINTWKQSATQSH